MQLNRHQLGQLVGANKREHFYELHYATGEIAHLYILADGIFRYFLDPNNNFDEAHTDLVQLENFDNSYFEKSRPRATSDSLIIQTGDYQLIFQQKPATMTIFDNHLHRSRMSQLSPLEIAPTQTCEILQQNKNEFYFGGGLQNGSFSHKGKQIEIKHDQITGAGGVISQVPFFWSNTGFAEFRNTTANGSYDFGSINPQASKIAHNDGIFDNFYLLGDSPSQLLAKYYLLTGQPLMPPKYSLGLGYLGNFVSTMWQPSEAKQRNANLFEDGGYYVRTQDETAASGKASLNGEEEYQFSARAMIDRFHKRDFPLAWFVPNYQVPVEAATFATFSEYAKTQGVESGLWTNSSPAFAKGFSFLATNDSSSETLKRSSNVLKELLDHKRQFILTNNGIAGSQKSAALFFGDNGGNWENIGTQVAGFIGAGLSGEPLVGSSVDGTLGGGNAQIAIRDFEWKALTPLLFSIDDQGNYSKHPFAYNHKMTQINRSYLALRKHLTPYLYTLLYQAQLGNPIVRALFLEFPHEQINYTSQVKHEFMLGSNLLVAPITNGREDGAGNSRKDNLYLPSHRMMWIDLFTGEKYMGGRVYNQLSYPTWHLPIFVKGGAIFDFGDRNFVFYPHGQSEITFYDDNGNIDYLHHHTETKVSSTLEGSQLTIVIEPTKGDFTGMTTEKATNLVILCDEYPDGISLKINDQPVKMQEYGTVDTFAHAREGFFYNTNYNLLPEFAQYQPKGQTALQIKLAPREITDSKIELTIRNFNYGAQTLVHSITDSLLRSPKQPSVDQDQITAHSLTITWPKVTDQVQVEINGILYDGISGDSYTFHELTPNTRYLMRLRNVSGNKASEWSEPFGAITKRAARDYAIHGVKVKSNYEANPEHPLAYLTDLKSASEWQTKDKFDETNPLTLTFTFDKLEKLSRVTFVPHNIDHQNDPTEVSVELSLDGQNFEPYGNHYAWKADSKNKVIGLRDVQARAVRLTIHQSSGPLVAGKEVVFYRDKSYFDKTE